MFATGIPEKLGVAILTAGKIHFKSKEVKRDKEAHYIIRDQLNNRK